MRKFKWSKLVRDKIVNRIKAEGSIPHYKRLTDEEFIIELKKKILEEAKEIVKTEESNITQEIADLQEVIDTLIRMTNVSKEKISQIQKIKNDEVGSFDKREYIETVETQDNSTWIQYYLDNPDKYPEIE